MRRKGLLFCNMAARAAKIKFGKSTPKSMKLPIFKTPGKLSRYKYQMAVPTII